MEVHPFKSIQSPFYDQFGQQWHLCHLGAAIAFTQVNLNRCSCNMLQSSTGAHLFRILRPSEIRK